mmetsp:Transcript_25602/g.49184  ORF Transcript_25602/g.49184 Transcript_25602/m.49184 type:complete len:445 (+) Transcript_25602:105-1439(+)
MPNPPSSPPSSPPPPKKRKKEKKEKKQAKKRKHEKHQSNRKGDESTAMHQKHSDDNIHLEYNVNDVGNAVCEGKVTTNDERGRIQEASGGSAIASIDGGKVAAVNMAKRRERENEALSRFHENDTAISSARCHQSSTSKPHPDFSNSGRNSNKRRHINNEEITTRNKKRTKKTRKCTTEGSNASFTSLSSTSSNNKRIFNGLVFAISTLESKNDNERNEVGPTDNENEDKQSTTKTNTTMTNTVSTPSKLNYQNYKTLTQILTQTLGAHSPISPQIHKRIHCLIATTPAIRNLTQRVRQAYKRNVDIVHVDWVRDCLECGKRLDYRGGNGSEEGYLWNDRVGEFIREKEELKKTEEEENKRKQPQKKYEKEALDHSGKCHRNYDDLAEEVIVMEGNDDDNAGWSTPIQLDCCCVCHENGDDNCPWCVDCNINVSKKQNNQNAAS